MKRKAFKNKKIIAVIAVMLVVTTAVALIVPSLLNKNGENLNYSNATAVRELAVNEYDKKLGEGASLLYDSQTSALGFALADGTIVAYSQNKASAENSLAALFNIRLRDKKGNSYTMDSSSNCMVFDGATESETDDNLFAIDYVLYTATEETGINDGGTKSVRVPVKFEYTGGKFNVSVDTSGIDVPSGWFVEKISLLPGLFSVGAGAVDTTYTIPDGCGAQIDMGTISEKPLALNLNVYGEDVSFYDYSQGALLPFFAKTENGVTINTIIEEGDALSQITCKRFEKGGGYLYNTFTVTPCSSVDGKFIKGESYNGVVSQSYIVTQESDGYNTIAAQVRDALTERNYLNASASNTFTDLPFFINVVGSTDGDNKLTSYESAAEITALLKSRGVRNIALRFSGYGKNGLETLNGDMKLSDALGGEDGFIKLNEEIAEQSNSLYIDANIFAKNGKSTKQSVIYNETSKFAGVVPAEFALEGDLAVNDNIASMYKFATGYQSANICLNDASRLLYTALPDVSRQEMLEKLSAGVSALGATGGLMLDYPAVYLMKQANSVFATPSTSSCEGFAGVTSVPVLQMVLHGSIVYGSTPVNISNLSSEDALLKCAEYGCVPTFLFTHSAETSISYSSYATQTAKLYSKAKRLSPILNMRMTSHEKVTDGVYKIMYDYSKVVYVNYNPSVVEINGVMISAKDFIVI